VTGPSAGGGRRGDAGGDFVADAGAGDAAGGRFKGADGVVLDFAGVDDDVIAVFASDVECALETPMRVTGVVLPAGFAATGFAAFTGVRTAGACARLAGDFLTGDFFACDRADADFDVARFTAGRLAAVFVATFFAPRPAAFVGAFFAAFFTAGRDATVRVPAVFAMALLGPFAAVFFAAFFAATLRAGAFFIALPLRIQGTAPRMRMASHPDYQSQPLPSLSTCRSVNSNHARKTKD
jgi:hypothetical protein